MGEPNHALRAARERVPSRSAPGEPLSRTELADMVNAWLWRETGHRYALDDHAVGRWERGRVHWPIAPYRAALRAVLAAPSDEALGFRRPRTSEHAPSHAGPEWTTDVVTAAATDAVTVEVINRRDALRAAALGGAALLTPLAGWLEPIADGPFAARSGAFSGAEVEALEHVAATFRQWRSAESGLGRTAVLGQLADVGQRLKGATPGPLTDRVFAVAAELARVSASMAFDAGDHRPAQDHYLLAARLARSGHDVVFGAVALSALARLQFDIGAADDGLNIVVLAQRGTRHTSSPRLTSMLATREAWGHAHSGDRRRFCAAVDSALETHGDATVHDPASLRSFDPAELHGTIGARYRDMARHDRRHAVDAVQHVTMALALREPDRTRNRAFDLVSLARVQLLAGEPDEAAESARSAIPHFDVHRPGRLGRKLADWVRESEPFRAVPLVTDVRDEIQHTVSQVRKVST